MFTSYTGEDLYSSTMLPVTASPPSAPSRSNNKLQPRGRVTSLTILTVTQTARSQSTGTTAKQNSLCVEKRWAETIYDPVLLDIRTEIDMNLYSKCIYTYVFVSIQHTFAVYRNQCFKLLQPVLNTYTSEVDPREVHQVPMNPLGKK